jgi:hypothetical protein
MFDRITKNSKKAAPFIYALSNEKKFLKWKIKLYIDAMNGDIIVRIKKNVGCVTIIRSPRTCKKKQTISK